MMSKMMTKLLLFMVLLTLGATVVLGQEETTTTEWRFKLKQGSTLCEYNDDIDLTIGFGLDDGSTIESQTMSFFSECDKI